MDRALALNYAAVTTTLLAFAAGLTWLVQRGPSAAGVAPEELLRPVTYLVALTGVVWLLMFTFRNLAVAVGSADIRYFKAYNEATPPEWIERPARAFMNLLEVPMLFYVLCGFMLITHKLDSTQLDLAWLFVALRALHAVVFIGVNHVPARLATYACGCITLCVLWTRFALTAL